MAMMCSDVKSGVGCSYCLVDIVSPSVVLVVKLYCDLLFIVK